LHAIAITDTNTLAGVVRAHVAAKEIGIQLIIGCRLQLTHPPLGPDGLNLLVYPTDRDSYGRLCQLLTSGKRRAEKGDCRLILHDAIEHSRGLLAVIIPPPYPICIDQHFIEIVSGLRTVFNDDRLSLAASCAYGPDDHGRLAQLQALSQHTNVPLAATNDVHYHVPKRKPLHDVLTCVRLGCTIDQAGLHLQPNAERHIKSPQQMAELFADAPQAIRRTAQIADRAAGTKGFSLDQLRYEYPDQLAPPGQTPMQYLIELTYQGAQQRYPQGVPDKVSKQLEHEFEMIEQLNYAPYFLTVYDLVRYARSRDILCQGRGAAANSAVCYCLGVTAVDPDRINILFERFISKERDEPPDIDIDFEHERREEVIQYIYGKYGRDRAALTAVVITYRARSAVRDVGKALGLSLDCVDRLAKNLDWWDSRLDGTTRNSRVRELGLNPHDPTMQHLLALIDQIVGFPRHLSQHVGGFVITRGALCHMVPIENAAMPDRTVIEWDKDDIDAMGMLKVDCLGLGMLTCISKCLAMVNQLNKKRHEGTQARRHEGTELETTNFQEIDYESDQNVSGPDCLAESHGLGASCLSTHTANTDGREIRLDQSDASSGGVHPIEHRGRIRQTKHTGLSEVSSNGQEFPGGTGNAIRVGDRSDDAAGQPADHRSNDRGGSNSTRPDPQHRKMLIPSPPSCLRASPSGAVPFPGACLELHTIPAEDPHVYDMLCKADTIGVFQIESRAQMTMLPRLKPRCYYDLVIEVAIVRPGPIQGDMVHPYLRRRNGEEPVTYPNEVLRRVLGRTLGVPLFQEQVMELAVVAAGFTPGEADQLRRAIAAWKSRGESHILKLRQRLVGGMIKRGYDLDFAERIFNQIKGFGDYGFPESHAASFALLVYASSWLKYHHPAAFAAALLNSQPMGFYAPAQIVRDAQEHGVEVHPVDVNFSRWDCMLEERRRSTKARGHEEKEDREEPALRLGMRLVKGLSQDHADAISNAARQHGPFASIDALWRASGVRIAALRRLARADAFGSMQLDRQQALWAMSHLRDEHLPLFEQTDDEQDKVKLPQIAPGRQVIADYASIGLSLKAHPMSFLRNDLDAQRVTPCAQLLDEAHWSNGKYIAVAGLVLVRQRPGTASGIIFMTLEDETGVANLIVRPHIFTRYRKAARHGVAVIAHGQVERQGRVVHVMVRRITDLSDPLAELTGRSRDFH